MKPILIILSLSTMLFSITVCAQSEPETSTFEPPTDADLFSIENLIYLGAFRLPAADFGHSSVNYAEGPIAYNPGRHSLFIVGHSHQQAIGEFAIPELSRSSHLSDLPMAAPALQAFSSLLDRSPHGNPQVLDRIGGLAFIQGNHADELFINAYEYYDAGADNSHTSLMVRNANDLQHSRVDGFFSFTASAGHSAGWLSPIPAEWQGALGGTYITGHSSGIPIIARASVGPSAFVFNPFELSASSKDSGDIATTPLLDFSLEHPLHSDLENTSGMNDLWTHLSRVSYGFIVPGSRSYLTLGYSGGHKTGVCYKCQVANRQDNSTCGGYCARDASDYSQYYWLWDLDDLLEVKKGKLAAYAVQPYAYGPWQSAFHEASYKLGGASFDPDSKQLYLSLLEADTTQGEFDKPPIILVYRIP